MSYRLDKLCFKEVRIGREIKKKKKRSLVDFLADYIKINDVNSFFITSKTIHHIFFTKKLLFQYSNHQNF